MLRHQRVGKPAPTFAHFNGRPKTRFPQRLKRPKLLPKRQLWAWKELKYHNEHDFNLAEYLVELDQPLGLSLAPDLKGQIYVAKVYEDSPAASNRVILEGDVLRKCSGAWGDLLSECTDLKHVQWAIRIRKGKVKLLLERRPPGRHPPPQWHRSGKNAQASTKESGLHRPLRFNGGGFQRWMTPGNGKPIYATFHRTVLGEDNRKSRESHRSEKAAKMRAELMEALSMASFDLSGGPVKKKRSTSSANVQEQKWGGSVPPSVVSNSVPYRNRNWAVNGTQEGQKEESITKEIERSRKGNGSHKAGKNNNSSSDSEMRSKLVTPIFPWLFVSNARLSHSDVVDFAGRCGLQCLLELRLEPCQGSLAVVGSCGVNSGVHAFVAAVGALHRLVVRREVCLRDSSKGCNNCSVLIHCCEGMEVPVAGLIAAYCFLHGLMGFDESIQLAEIVMQAPVPRDIVKEGTAFLNQQALERHSGVMVAWRYGGKNVEVAGDLVGGWDHRSSLKKCPPNPSPCQFVPHGTHFVRLTGLQPGLYNYKFIVDGAWQVDFLGPKAMDKMGNWNNILKVKPAQCRTKRMSPVDMMRVEAALVAFRTKRDAR
ncbi:hypothetical protein BSKO_11019 [Bryopsis sp. KO-2023]|nr:hypothetical protein BSKO_11019 [Bryopsis sp. KO-2023]